MKQEEVVGTFRLVSWHRQDQSEPFGPHPAGVLQYGADGRMSVIFLKPGRTRLGVPGERMAEANGLMARPWLLPFHGRMVRAMARYAKAATGFMAYAGTFEVAGDTISHHVDLALVPDDIGETLVRGVSLDGSMLTLTVPTGDVLLWERVTTPGPATDLGASASPAAVRG